MTAVAGLDAHGLDLKKVAKEMGRKFATGASVTKNAAGTADEVVLQGDLCVEVEEWIAEVYGDMVPEGNVEIVDEKKKKG